MHFPSNHFIQPLSKIGQMYKWAIGLIEYGHFFMVITTTAKYFSRKADNLINVAQTTRNLFKSAGSITTTKYSKSDFPQTGKLFERLNCTNYSKCFVMFHQKHWPTLHSRCSLSVQDLLLTIIYPLWKLCKVYNKDKI